MHLRIRECFGSAVDPSKNLTRVSLPDLLPARPACFTAKLARREGRPSTVLDSPFKHARPLRE